MKSPVGVQVSSDRVIIEVLSQHDRSGETQAELTVTEQVADELRERLGNLSICL